MCMCIADMVFRLDATIKPNLAEQELLHKAMSEGIWDCSGTDPASAPAVKSSSSTSGDASPTDRDTLLPIPATAKKAPKGKASAVTGSIKQSPGNDGIDDRIRNLRHGFTAAPGYVLLCADYAQNELRLLAHFSQDTALCKAFEGKIDVFIALAARWLEKPIDEITKADRELIKRICYANIYGSGPNAIAEDLDISVDEAALRMQEFLDCYPGIRVFMSQVKEACHTNGFVETLLGRRRIIKATPQLQGFLSKHGLNVASGLNDPNTKDMSREMRKEKAKLERQALNSVCQGSAADLVKVSLL